jgi:hypothetical protein
MARPQFQKDAKLVVNIQKPKPKPIGVLPGETMSETRSGGHLQIVEHNHGPYGCLVHRQKESVLALGGVGWTVHQNKPCLLQTPERFPLRRDIEGFDGPEPVPATREWNNRGKICLALFDLVLEFFRAIQPIRRIFDACRGGRGATKRIRGAARAEFKSTAACRQKRRHLFKETTAQWRKDPGRSLGGAILAAIFLNEALKLSFERIEISDNPSELLSAFRGAIAVSAPF